MTEYDGSANKGNAAPVHDTEAYGVEEVYLHSFVNSIIDSLGNRYYGVFILKFLSIFEYIPFIKYKSVYT